MSPATFEETEAAVTSEAEVSGRWVPQQYFDPGFKEAVVAQLNALRQLAEGWDGYHGCAINHAIVDAAIAVIQRLKPHLAPRPRIVPLTSGGLQLEWNTPVRSLELEFETTSTIHYLRWQPSAQIEDEDVIAADDTPKVEALIGWFARSDV